jgi:signal transduction histidine kinase
MKAAERRRTASRLPDLRSLAPRLAFSARRGTSVAILYMEFTPDDERAGASREELATVKQATAAALKAAIGTILRKGDLAAAGRGGRWFIVLLAARADARRPHGADEDLGVAAQRLRAVVQQQLSRAQTTAANGLAGGSLRVRCGWNVVEPAADPLEALRHAVRGAALVARVEERRATVLAAVTHELRTPLTSIIGFAERLQDRTCDAAQRHKSVGIILDEARRLQRLTDGLIDIGSWNAGALRLRRRRASLAEIAGQAGRTVAEKAASRQVAIEVVGDAHVSVDRDRCLQILINLLDNAVRYSPRGGTVAVRIARKGNQDQVTVIDRGAGFGAAVVKNRGAAFHAGGDGKTGLGLAIARILTEAHGGALRIEPRRRGGMVSVTFPRTQPRYGKNPAGPNRCL